MLRIYIDTAELNRFASRMNKYSKDKQEEVKKIINNTTLDIQKYAKEYAPMDKGFLKNSIDATILNNRLTGRVSVKRKYGIFVHEGTRPHVIRPRFKKVLAWQPFSYNSKGKKLYTTSSFKKIKISGIAGRKAVVTRTTTNAKKGNWIHASEVFHPGTKANPFLMKAVNKERPIFESKIMEALSKS